MSCRTRKVRCDVLRGDTPCTNCRLDGVQCVVVDSTRGKKAPSIDRDERELHLQERRADHIPVSLTFDGKHIQPFPEKGPLKWAQLASPVF